MTEFAREYGTALYDLCAEEGLAERVLGELGALKAAFSENPKFVKLLDNLSLQKEERIAILDETLKAQAHPYVLNFLRLLTDRGAAGAFRECAAAYEECFRRDHRIVEAEVTTAKPLTEEERDQLRKKIFAMTGRQSELHEKIDESLLGGVLLQMDGKRYDNTVKGRLKKIRRAMTEA